MPKKSQNVREQNFLKSCTTGLTAPHQIYYCPWLSGFSPCVPTAQLKFVLSCITSSFFFVIQVVWIIFFSLPQVILKDCQWALSSLTSPWKHRIILAEGVRRLGDLACAYKVGIETSTSFLSENYEEAPSWNLTSWEASPSVSEVDSLSKVTFIFDDF